MFTVNIAHPPEYDAEDVQRIKQVILATIDGIQEFDNNATVEVFASEERFECFLHNTIDIEIVVSCKRLMQLQENRSPVKANIENAVGDGFPDAQVLCHLISKDSDTEVSHLSNEYVHCK